MVNPLEYSEIPGEAAYNARPKRFAKIKRMLRDNKIGIVAALVIAGSLILAGVISTLVTSEPEIASPTAPASKKGAPPSTDLNDAFSDGAENSIQSQPMKSANGPQPSGAQSSGAQPSGAQPSGAQPSGAQPINSQRSLPILSPQHDAAPSLSQNGVRPILSPQHDAKPRELKYMDQHEMTKEKTISQPRMSEECKMGDKTCMPMQALLNLTWPRRDNTWYGQKWDRTMRNRMNISSRNSHIHMKTRHTPTTTPTPIPTIRNIMIRGILPRHTQSSSTTMIPGHGSIHKRIDSNQMLKDRKKDPKTEVNQSDEFSGTIFDDFGDSVFNETDPADEFWNRNDGSTFPVNDTFNWNREVHGMTPATDKQIKEAFDYAEQEQEKDRVRSEQLVRKGFTLKPGTPNYRHQKFFKRSSPKVQELSRQGSLMGHATQYMKRKFGLTRQQMTLDSRWLADARTITAFCRNAPYPSGKENLMQEDFSHQNDIEEGRSEYHYEYNSGKPKEVNPEVEDIFSKRYTVHKKCMSKQRYRTLDGTCNNLRHPTWGSALIPFRRALPPSYEDGISVIRKSVSGEILPPAKLVSELVMTDRHVESKAFTHLAMTWGQIVDHDITITGTQQGPGRTTIDCCPVNNTVLHPQCLPIYSRASPHFEWPKYKVAPASAEGPPCVSFVRSAPAPSCHFGARNHINENTAFLDGSMIYGSSPEHAYSLRAHTDGHMASWVTLDGRELLMRDKSNATCYDAKQATYDRYCFKSGDSRVNENVMMTGINVVILREHNRVASELLELNPHWGDDRLYEEARRIVIAELQHITYNEYVPSILGPELTRRLALAPGLSGFWRGYDPSTDPGIANEFAAAAYRFGHSMITGLIQSISADGKKISFKQLKSYFFEPFELYDMDGLGSLVRGQLSQRSSASDSHFTPQVTKHLFEGKNEKGKGLDLVALNIQRGRDHGVAPYLRWRMWCGLSPVESFDDLKDEVDVDTLDKMKKIYKDVKDIDLFVGGLAESPVKDGLLGPTFACIISDQFLRLKTGDRFWYETNQLPQSFSPEQLKTLRHSSLAGLLCRNIDTLNSLQRWPLRVFSTGNPRVGCATSFVPRLELSNWADGEL